MYRFYLYHPDIDEPQLVSDPVGWDDLGKKMVRDEKWHGVFWEYSPKLQFIKDARKFILYYYEKYGIEAEITLTRYKKNSSTRKFDLDYTGRLNTTSLKFDRTRAECNVEQTGFIQKLKNRADVKVDLNSATSQGGESLSNITPETVEIPSKVITKVLLRDKQYKKIQVWFHDVEYGIDNIVQDADGYFKSLQNFNENHATTDTDWWVEIPKEEADAAATPQFASFQVAGGDVWYIIPSFNPETLSKDELETREKYDDIRFIKDVDPTENLYYIMKAKESGKYRFNFDSWNRLIPASGITGDLDLILKFGRSEVYTEVVVGNSNDFATDIHHFDNNFTYNIRKGDEIYIYWRLTVDSSPSFNTVLFFEDYIDLVAPIPSNLTSIMSIEGDTVFPNSNNTVILLHEAMARTVESITDKKDVLKTTYYGRTDSAPRTYAADGEGSLRGLLNGKRVRGFPDTAPVYTTLNELISVAQALDGVGFGVEKSGNTEYGVMEKLDYFYAPRKIMRLDYVRDIERMVNPKGYYNQISGGVDKWNNQMVGNLDEVNRTREYLLPLTQIKQSLDLRCKYITSSYTIEALRRDPYTLSRTKDNSLDEDNVLLCLRRDGDGYKVDRNEDFDVLAGINSPETLLNAKLMPMRCIIRNGPMIRGGLWRRDNESIVLSGSDSNASTRLTTETDVVSEKSIAVNKLGKALWINEIYRFKYPVSREELAMIEADPYGYLEFSVDGKNYAKGFIMDIEPEGKEEKLLKFTLKRANL